MTRLNYLSIKLCYATLEFELLASNEMCKIGMVLIAKKILSLVELRVLISANKLCTGNIKLTRFIKFLALIIRVCDNDNCKHNYHETIQPHLTGISA